MTSGLLRNFDSTAHYAGESEIYYSDMYAEDIASIAAEGTGAASTEHYVIASDAVRVVVKLTGGNALADDRIDFRFASIGYAGESYPSNADFTISVDMNGTSPVSQAFIIDTRPYYKLKILGIDNTSADYAVTDVNATISYYYRVDAGVR